MSRSSSTFSSETWIRSARSGSSFREKMPRFVRGTRPKWMVSGSPRVRPSATLTGSMSPIRSPTLVSGVASFSPYLSSRCRQVTGRSSPSSAASRRQRAQAGAVGVVVDLAARDDRRPLVEQAGQGADQPGLTLAALAEQDDVVPGDQGPLEVGQDGLAEPDDAGKRVLARPHHGEQVVPDLFLDAAVHVAAGAQLSEGGGGGGRVRLAVLLHHSTVCRDRRSSASARGPAAAAGPRGWMAHWGPVDMTSGTVSSDDVTAARKLIHDVISDTPVLHSRVLSETIGGPVYLKCENLQRTGSFKVRGAYFRIARLSDAERARGVVAASAGNHAQGVAFAAGLLGCAATVVMPEGAPLPKVQATRGYGADVILHGTCVEDAAGRGHGLRRADRRGVHPSLRPP